MHFVMCMHISPFHCFFLEANLYTNGHRICSDFRKLATTMKNNFNLTPSTSITNLMLCCLYMHNVHL